jgi:hypothetical protein
VDAVFVAAVAAALAAASPVGSAPPALHVIVRGANAGGICGNVVVHANAAIAAALHDDQTLERSAGRLRDIDFDERSIAQRNGVAELHRLSGDIADTSARGTSEVQRLRVYAVRIDEDRQRTELTVFADSLQSALEQQQRMGLELDKFLAGLAYRELRDSAALPSEADPDVIPTPRHLGPGADPGSAGTTASAEAQVTAADFENRLADVRRDESHAADLSEAAVGGC